MLQCCSIISKNLTWDFGDGKNAFFLEDSWDSLPTSTYLDLSPNIKSSLTRLWGKFVTDYQVIIILEHSVNCEWKSVAQTNLTESENK